MSYFETFLFFSSLSSIYFFIKGVVCFILDLDRLLIIRYKLFNDKLLYLLKQKITHNMNSPFIFNILIKITPSLLQIIFCSL